MKLGRVNLTAGAGESLDSSSSSVGFVLSWELRNDEDGANSGWLFYLNRGEGGIYHSGQPDTDDILKF